MASSGVVTPSLAGARSSRTAQLVWAVAGALALVRCGGGAPLLHSAHVLPVNTVSFGAGLSGQFASDDITLAISRGRSAATAPLTDASSARSYSDGVLTQALVGPGIAPYVSARVGLPEETEAGLTYTGRGIRLDGRYAYAFGESLALSLGLGATALLLSPDSSAPGPGSGATPEAEFELNAKGWGLDAPILFGYQGIGGLFELWAGARGGLDQIDGQLRSNASDASAPRIDAAGRRWWAGAITGFSVGVPPLWLRFEVATTFHKLSGELSGGGGAAPLGFGQLDATGWTLSPSGAIVGKF